MVVEPVDAPAPIVGLPAGIANNPNRLRWAVDGRDNFSPSEEDISRVLTLYDRDPAALRAAERTVDRARRNENMGGMRGKDMCRLPIPARCELCAYTAHFVEQNVAHLLSRNHHMVASGRGSLCGPCGTAVSNVHWDHHVAGEKHLARVARSAAVPMDLSESFPLYLSSSDEDEAGTAAEGETSDEEKHAEKTPGAMPGAAGGGSCQEQDALAGSLEQLALPGAPAGEEAQREDAQPQDVAAPLPPAQPPPTDDISTYELPGISPPRVSFPHEVYMELDALCFAVVGTRLEWDFFCPDGESSPCTFRGSLPVLMPISGVDGLYHSHPSVLPLVVSAMASNHARGLVILSPDISIDSPPCICPAFGPKSKSAGRRVPWRRLLEEFTVLKISIPASCGRPEALAVFASFLHAVPLRPNKKGLRHIEARPVKALAGSDGKAKLGPVPDLLTRPSKPKSRPPRARDRDTVSEVPCPGPDGASRPVLPEPAATMWQEGVFAEWAEPFHLRMWQR